MTVALGQPFRMDCVGHVTASTSMMVLFYKKGALLTTGRHYRYPTSSDFPQYTIERVELDNDRDCYRCALFYSDPLDDPRVLGKSILTVYGENIPASTI